MMIYTSIISKEAPIVLQEEVPEFFGDLNLNQIVNAIVKGRENYPLQPYFYTPCHSKEEILFRQEIFQDVENPTLYQHLLSFSTSMQELRSQMEDIQKSPYPYEKERCFAETVENYCQAIAKLQAQLDVIQPASYGLQRFGKYLETYLHSDYFKTLEKETAHLFRSLNRIRYQLIIQDLKVTVKPYAKDEHYQQTVERTVKNLIPKDGKEYLKEFPEGQHLNHIENQILEIVARKFPEPFQQLHTFYETHPNFIEEKIATFDREIQFYLSYLAYIQPVKEAGLSFCYPDIAVTDKKIFNENGFDLALASKIKENTVPNPFYLEEKERILVVTGPNQGGKTTFARMFGQLHFLSSLGCPVPGNRSRLFCFDTIFSHFERQEDIQTLRGKLEDDLFRIHHILEHATSNSIVILNEIFSSTTLEDALWLGKNIINQLIERDLLAVCVTFLDELAAMDKTVSMMSTIVTDHPSERSYKIIRKPADGLAYALTIAQKYRLTYPQIIKRIP